MRPKASSKLEQIFSGSHISGTVASIKARYGDEDSVLVFPVWSLNEVDATLTIKSRERSLDIETDSIFLEVRALSYPPNVSVARVPFPATT